jgi:hypothetical protein
MRSYNINIMHYSSMDWHYFHVTDVWCNMENDNGVIRGYVTAIPMLINAGDLNMG